MSGSTFSVRCAGCNFEETHPWTGLTSTQYSEIMAEMAERGWHRRTFGPGASPWFCSTECAHESYWSKQCEEWWEKKAEEDRQKEFEDYCNDKSHTGTILLGIMAFLAILATAAAVGDCLNARLP